jgi:hypothetical protein
MALCDYRLCMNFQEAVDRAERHRACSDTIAALRTCSGWLEASERPEGDFWLRWATDYGIFDGTKALQTYHDVCKPALEARDEAYKEISLRHCNRIAKAKELYETPSEEFRKEYYDSYGEYVTDTNTAMRTYQIVVGTAWCVYSSALLKELVGEQKELVEGNDVHPAFRHGYPLQYENI